MNRLEARDDGKCVVCESAFAATVGGVLCRRCLKAAIERDYPIFVRDLSQRGTEETGRPARNMTVIGGSPY